MRMRWSALSPDARRIVLGLAGAAAVVGVTVGLEIADPPPTGAGLAPLGPRLAPAERLGVASLAALDAAFARLGYDFDAVRSGEAAVPRIMVLRLPEDLAGQAALAERKRLFLKSVLPLVLRVNETIRAQRATLEALLRRREAGERLGRRERAWLAAIAAHYRAAPDDAAALRSRVRPIPASLALAQAAAESGWGGSRFARMGNALYGQWTWSEKAGLAPLRRAAGETHRVKAYPRLLDSVWDYARNLNTNPAYRAFRSLRARLAADGTPAGMMLAATLGAYSQKGMEYVGLIRDVIRQNRLARLDAARLSRR